MTTETQSDFARATAVTGRPDSTFATDLDGAWTVAGAVNGGYLLSVIGRALSATVPEFPDPLVISAYYLAAATPAPLR